MKLLKASNIRLCVFIIVISYNIPSIDGSLKSKKILYGLAVAHVLGLLKQQHTTHHVPVFIPPMKKSCYPKCHKDYHFHEHINMMSSYDDHDSYGSLYSGMDGYDDDDFGGDGLYSDELSSASYVMPKKSKYKKPKYKKIHHFVDDSSIEDDYGTSISAKSSAGSKHIDSDDPTIDEEVIEEEYIDDSEYETESAPSKPRKKKGWKRYLKKLKLKPKRSLKLKTEKFTNYDDDDDDGNGDESTTYDDDKEDEIDTKMATHQSQTSQSTTYQGQEMLSKHSKSHPSTVTSPSNDHSLPLPASLLKLNISGDSNQLDKELDDITVDKMFAELVRNNPNNKVLEAIQKELESPLRSFLRNTKIAKLIKKRNKTTDESLKSTKKQPIASGGIESTTNAPPKTSEHKLITEVFQSHSLTTPPTIQHFSQQKALPMSLPNGNLHSPLMYAQPMLMPINPAMLQQASPPAYQLSPQQITLAQQQLSHQQQHQQQSHFQYPTHHSLTPYSQLPAPDHYLPEESKNIQFKLIPAPGQPIIFSQIGNGEIIADEALMPVSESFSKHKLPKQSKKPKPSNFGASLPANKTAKLS